MTGSVKKAIVPTNGSKPGVSIRGRLLILAMAAIAPLAVERTLSIEGERNSEIELARQHALTLARQGAERQNETLVAARGTLQLIARAYPKFIESKVPCAAFLQAALAETPGVKTISVVGADGKVACSANPDSVGLDVSDRPHFQQALRDGGFVVSDYAQSLRALGPIIVAGYGDRSPSGAVDAVFSAVLDLDWISRLAADIGRRAGSVVLLVDSDGTVLTRYPNPDQWMGKNFAHLPLIKAVLAQSEGVLSAPGIDGLERIYAFKQLPGTSARFIIGVNQKEALQAVNVAMMRSYAQLVVVGALVLTGIWFGGESFLNRPIRAFAQTATEIGQGHVAARVMHPNVAPEFIPLATAMDTMADRLATREAKLRATNENLEILAQRDGLTGLANRRVFDARLPAAMQVSVALGAPLALLMIDVDHFKLFNDRYGHLEGDACLRGIAGVLLAGTRGEDIAARYGGEEFAVLLSGVTIDQAEKIAERLRKGIEDLAIPHADSAPGHVTVSIGLATVADSGARIGEALIKAADDALYAAKARGRNNVAVAASVTPMVSV